VSSPNSALQNRVEIREWRDLARIIDHTNLRPETTPGEIVRLCQEAKEFSFGAVMVNGWHVPLADSQLLGTGVKVGAVVGFPFGACLTDVKRFETVKAVRQGASEIDMVINVGALKAGDREFVLRDIHALAEVAHEHRALLKVILEMGLLTEDEKRLGCSLSEEAGADFVKTSTGFLAGGATAEDVMLMRRAVKIGVKASGGIRTLRDARAMIEAGANRLGTSSGVNIIREMRETARD
jgi:deoxyribose-phosphate aldolase